MPLLTLTLGSAGPCQLLGCADPRPVESLPAWLEVWAALRSVRIMSWFACHSGQLLPVRGAPAHGEAQSAQADGSTQRGGAGGRDTDTSPLPQIPLLPPPICISWWRLSFLCGGFFHLQSPGLLKACGPTAGCMEEVEGNMLEPGSGLCRGRWQQGGSTKRSPKSCPVPQKLGSNSPGGWEIQLPTGQIPLGWPAQKAAGGSLILAGSS